MTQCCCDHTRCDACAVSPATIPDSRAHVSLWAMSGTALLEQLRKRQRPAPVGSSATSSTKEAASASSDGVRIIVCNGVDCTGHGSGAALLEIEELCLEVSYMDPEHRIRVLSGVCTLQCANAPVVNVQRQSKAGVAKTTHHSQVDGPLRCQQVVDDAASESNLEPTRARSIMLRRADGLRWSALRQESRARRQVEPSPSPQLHEPGPASRHPPRSQAPNRPLVSEQLVSAFQAEARAAASEHILSERAARRATRMAHRISGAGQNDSHARGARAIGVAAIASVCHDADNAMPSRGSS